MKLGAHGARGEGPRSAEAWPGLDERVRARRTALGGHWEETKRVAVTADARSETLLSVSAEANTCLDVFAVADDGVAMLELEVADAEGRVISRAHDGSRERAVVVIEVSDTGPGLSEKARAHLFEAFQGSTRSGSVGLGLAIVAELVRAHGGEIRLVEGTIGATFRVSIPDRAVDLDTRRARASA